MANQGPQEGSQRDSGGAAEALRAAIERTLAATAPAASETRERAEGIVGELSKRGHEARDEIARRGQEAGAELAKRGQDARQALTRRGEEASSEIRGQLEALEGRLAAIEELLRRNDRSEGSQGDGEVEANPKPKS